MFNKPRKSLSQRVFEVLNERKTLTSMEMTQFQNLKGGYQGEVVFANVLKEFVDPIHSQLYDLTLFIDGSAAQFDALLLLKDSLLHFEVKNLNGEYYVKDNLWFHLTTNQQINHPAHQISRANRLLKRFLFQPKVQLPVKSYTVFVNPQFHLYHAPIDQQYIFPAQIKRFFEMLNQKESKNYSHADILNLLKNAHVDKLPQEVLPKYSYEKLQKGIFCDYCSNGLIPQGRKYIKCPSCLKSHTFEDTILKNALQFSLLFPDEPPMTKVTGFRVGANAH